MTSTPTEFIYEITVRGELGASVIEAFPALRAELRRGCTVLTGPVADQSALQGVLSVVAGLGLELLAVTRQ